MLELTYEYLNWPTLQLLYGELAKSGGAVVPTAKSAVVVGTTLTDAAEINATNAASIKVYDQTKEIFLEYIPTGVPAANEYTVNGTTGVITFNASQTGSTVSYQFAKAYTSIESIGSGLVGTQTDYLDDLSLTAIISSAVYPKGILLSVPKIVRTNTPSLAIQGDKAVVSITYKCLTPAGARKPFTMYKLDGAV